MVVTSIGAATAFTILATSTATNARLWTGGNRCAKYKGDICSINSSGAAQKN